MGAETGPDEAERDAVWAACERRIHWHNPQNSYELLRELTGESSPAEEPDRYGQGAAVQELEGEVAEILGKEAALMVPTGTMAQQVALRVWNERSGRNTVAMHPTSHLEQHEHKAYQVLHGMRPRLVGEPERLIALEDLEAVPEALSVLLLELPQREIGGQLPTWDDLQAQLAWARERGVRIHMDGARLWESAPYYGRSYAEIAAGFDSVYVSFYKGLGALAGAGLAGPADFIAEARPWVRRHGGMVFSMLPYAVSARARLRQRLDRFPQYHQRALDVAAVLDAVPGISVKPNPPHTNMMHVYLRGDRERLLTRSFQIAEEEDVALFRSLRPTSVPDHWMFELVIGDAVEALGDEEIGAYFERVMSDDSERE